MATTTKAENSSSYSNITNTAINANNTTGDAILASAAASAPGKLILFGEHAVVYGQPAICAALTDLRITVTCEETWDGCIHIYMPDLVPPIQFSAPTKDLQILFHETNDDSMVVNPENIYQKILQHNKINNKTPDEFAVQALSPVIYLLNAIVPRIFLVPTHGIRILVQSSSLPIGAGLGSSAAFSVATSAALYKLSLLLQRQTQQNYHHCDDDDVLMGRPSNDALQQINNYAYQAERINHGTPSGLDNTVSCYGGILYFIKNTINNNGNNQQQPSFTMEHLDHAPPLHILLINSGVPRSTKKMVETVRQFKQDFPDIADDILNACGAISKTFYRMVSSTITTGLNATNNDNTTHDLQQQQPEQQQLLDPSAIATLIETNQCLLRAMKVSHPALERICDITKHYFGLSTKLTGAGGGGCAFTYLGGTATTATQPIQNALTKEGFQCMESTVGGSGVLWVVPSTITTGDTASYSNTATKNRVTKSFLLAIAGASIFGSLLLLTRKRTRY